MVCGALATMKPSKDMVVLIARGGLASPPLKGPVPEVEVWILLEPFVAMLLLWIARYVQDDCGAGIISNGISRQI